MTPDNTWLSAAYLQSLPPSLPGLPLWVAVCLKSPSSFCYHPLVIGFRADPKSRMISSQDAQLSSICKNPISNRVIFPDPQGWTYLLGVGHSSTYYSALREFQLGKGTQYTHLSNQSQVKSETTPPGWWVGGVTHSFFDPETLMNAC